MRVIGSCLENVWKTASTHNDADYQDDATSPTDIAWGDFTIMDMPATLHVPQSKGKIVQLRQKIGKRKSSQSASYIRGVGKKQPCFYLFLMKKWGNYQYMALTQTNYQNMV